MAMPVTAHFAVDEFACHDGTPYPIGSADEVTQDGRTWLETRLKPLCDTLETIRSAGGDRPLAIDSGYRTLAYDAKLYKAHIAATGGDGMVADPRSSQHPQGRAADIQHATLKPVQLFNLILALYEHGELPALGGIGLYPSFVHIDVRPRAGADGTPTGGHLAIWGGSRPSNVA